MINNTKKPLIFFIRKVNKNLISSKSNSDLDEDERNSKKRASWTKQV